MARYSNEDIWESRADRFADRFTERPVWTSFKILVIILIISTVIWVIGGFFGFLHSWGSKAAEVLGPQNTDAQFTALYGDMESMRVAAQNACQVKDAAHTGNSPTFLEDPTVAYAARYRGIEADYNRRFENIFEASALLIKPGDLPKRAPTLEQMQAQVC